MYEIGLLVALVIWFSKIIWVFLQINSNVNLNLSRIGQRLSWLSLTAKPLTKEYLDQGAFYKIIKFSIIWVFIPFVFVFTSWIYVGYSIAIILYKKSKDSGKPLEIKELQWKMKNLNLNFDQMVEIMMKVNSLDETKIDEYKAAIKAEMENNGLI